MNINEMAKKGFNAGAAAYESGRPMYPKEAIDKSLELLHLTSKSQVLDLAAGTGKLTRSLLTRVAQVFAVEPVDAMRETLQRELPEANVMAGTAESIPLPDHSVDAVTVAQAFHWFDGARALPEIHRVLKAESGLGIFWNWRDDSFGWVKEMNAIADPYQGNTPNYVGGQWKAAFSESKLFTPLVVHHFTQAIPMAPESIVDRIASISYIAALPHDELTKVKKEIAKLLRRHPATAGKEKIDFPYRSELYSCLAR